MNLLEVLLSEAERKFFADFTRDVTDACRYSCSQDHLGDGPKPRAGFDPVKPGGLKSYPAVWTQDFTMIFAAGFLPWEAGCDHLRLILNAQNGEQMRELATGAQVPPYAIADHVNFDGSAVFYPGTYSSGPDQGGEKFGYRPPYNNYYDVIWLAWLLVSRSGGEKALLREKIGGLDVFERLCKAFDVPPVDALGMVYTTEKERAVGFIFCDTIYMTGQHLMATLLRRRAAGHLRDLAVLLQLPDAAQHYAQEVVRGEVKLADVFLHPSGWLRACTGVSAQPDVFGSLYALYTGAVTGAARETVYHAVLDGLSRGQIEEEGALRHVPLEHSFSATSAWEKTQTGGGTYQNGAYWHMPAGWMTAVLYQRHPVLAANFFGRYLAHMQREDFRKKSGTFAPWEWINGALRSDGVPVFGPSATLPYAVLAGLV